MRIQNQEEASSSRPHKRTGPSCVTKVTGGVVPARAAELLLPGDARLDRRIAPLEADIAWHHVLCHGDKASLSAPRAWLSPTRRTFLKKRSMSRVFDGVEVRCGPLEPVPGCVQARRSKHRGGGALQVRPRGGQGRAVRPARRGSLEGPGGSVVLGHHGGRTPQGFVVAGGGGHSGPHH